MIVEFNTFASRLQNACETDEPAEIARLTELTYQTVENYLLGRLPTADALIKLSEKLGVPIHWLLTGFGPQFVEDLSTVVEFSFEQHERKVIAEIANAGGITFEETVVHLVREALAMKGIGQMPDFMPVPVFQTMDDELFLRLSSLPAPERKAETERLIGKLVLQSVNPPQ